MKISATELKYELAKVFPEAMVKLADADYWQPSRKGLDEVLRASQIDIWKYARQVGDCDDFALVLHAEVKKVRWGLVLEGLIDKEEAYPWAFGECWGRMFKREPMNHAINWCLTRDQGILLIEPQTDEVWKAVKYHDFPYFMIG